MGYFMVWAYALISVTLVSLISLIGVIALAVKRKNLEKVLLILVAFSVGALLGDAFIHLLPEAVEELGGFPSTISLSLLAGILLFFCLERFLRWRHCHKGNCEDHPKHLGTMNLVGDTAHNLIDGILIGASYLASIPLGLATTIAVIAHEVPQEIGDFGVLLHSGMSKRKALLYNFYSACAAILGVVLVLSVGSGASHLVETMIPLTAGGFIYIAMSDLIPELHKDNSKQNFLPHFIAILAGIALMFLLLGLE